MNFPVLRRLATFLLLILSASCIQAKIAQIFLKYNITGKVYILNEDIVDEISRLQQPIRVIAVLGDARIGKSTTLNMVSHIWSGESKKEVEEIFETGDTMESVTHDVWAYIFRPRQGTVESGESVILLDVAGTNLGDDTLTTHLSMFTALISSSLNIFVHETFQNNNLHFLYHLSRLSSVVFPNITLNNFPKLRVVVRNPLQAPEDRSVEEYVRWSVADPEFKESMRKERKAVSKYFPPHQIDVTPISFVDRKLFSNFEELRNSEYWNEMKKLVRKFQEVQMKRTFEGSPIDGNALAELAVRIVRAMNANSWHEFGNVYDALEKDICKRNHEKLIKPLFAAHKSEEMRGNMSEALRKFTEACVLKSEIVAANEELRKFVETMQEKEELEEKARKAENDRKESERERKKEQEEFMEKMKEINKKSNAGWKDHILSVGLGVAIGRILLPLLSDIHLKHNVTTNPLSLYNSIGLNGVCWEWNIEAKVNFGLTGEGCGVIAQEVAKIYPWAVTKDENGYLRVRYDALHELISNSHIHNCVDCGYKHNSM